MQVITVVVRVFQIIFATIVLGLSVTLAKGQAIGSAPAITGYAGFTGALGIVASLVGIAALFVSSLDGLITWILDGLASLAFLAGGIAFAVILKGTNCEDKYTIWNNQILSGGCVTVKDEQRCYNNDHPNNLKSRCTSAKADSAFMFIDFAFSLAVIGCSFFLSGRRGVGRSNVV
ncbi:hypothetical protein EYZ11_005293 [Aspergillus tanneri]|uniref:MARVEL domain-containing protein n=1 Tax=Aspergillus tanneri TaxID=1220188 RepID=A0A4S3JI89_9EURO|nr:uncharacterized protein ATNIH1004_009124 [Aspergillus tanneri]KAA8644913.1 hypothetical protein ATNIH1004_009124 [Aspergillus tanneri]THC95216.1 hypothetical protein EYZ11_005293 [Aspergillus tanneri]